MSKVVVVTGEGSDIIIRVNSGRGRTGDEYRLVVDPTGDLAFIAKGVIKPYRFEPDVLFADKHQILMQLEAGEYKSLKTKGNVKFVCRGLKEATIKWSMAYMLSVYVTCQNIVLAKMKPTGRINEVAFDVVNIRGLPHGTVFSDEFIEFLTATVKRHRV